MRAAVVTSATGGILEVVVEGKTGHLVRFDTTVICRGRQSGSRLREIIFHEPSLSGNAVVKFSRDDVGFMRHPVHVRDSILCCFTACYFDERLADALSTHDRVGIQILQVTAICDRPTGAMVKIMDKPDGVAFRDCEDTPRLEFPAAEKPPPSGFVDFRRKLGLVKGQIIGPL